MKLFQDGGLEQDGGTVDPVSGNEVPIGSAKEEVRDDISAKLSEGEFVFPADVVRYYGLESLMKMRQEAKAGLKRMEDMGQMGNSDEATLPDDIPFTPDDVTVEDDAGNEGDLEMQTGGIVPTPYGTQPHQGPGVYSQPSQMGSQFNINPNYQFQPAVAYPMVMPQPQPQTGYGPSFVGQQPQPHTGFDKLIPMPTQQYNNIRFVNAAGEVMIIPHVDGKPVFPIPEGYSREDGKGDAPKEDAKVDETVDTSVPTATVTSDREDPDRMFVDGKWMTKEQRIKAENIKSGNRSYDNMFKLAWEQSPDKSLEGITKFIKDGNVKAKVLGFDIKMPGWTFNEKGISDAYYRAYDEEMDATETDAAGRTTGVKTGTKIKTDAYGKIIPDELSHKSPFDSAEKVVAKASKPKVIQTSTAEGSAGEREAQILKEKQDIEAIQATAREKIKREALAKAEAEGRDAAQAEREANRAKAQQKKLDDYTSSKIAEQRTTGRIRGFKKGGIASKPKKKAMKRGGLASKK